MWFEIFFLIAIYYLFRAIFKSSSFQEFIHYTFIPKKNELKERKLFEKMSDEEMFALSLGDLEYERIAKKIERSSLKAYLEEEYGLSFEEGKEREHLLYSLDKIWKEGSISLFFRHNNLHKYVAIRDMVAYDSARFTELLRHGLHLKFIEEEEAWGFLFLNLQRVQDSYCDWYDFRDAYFRATTLIAYSEDKKHEDFNFKMEWLKAKTASTVKEFWLEENLFSQIIIKDR